MIFRRLLLALIFSAIFVLLTGLAQAASSTGGVYRNLEDSTPQEIVDAMASKGVRGAANIATGWLEIPKQIYVTTKEDGWPRGVVIGPLKGIGMTVVRTVTGFGELATFFVAFPGFYSPWFEPAYVWQKE